VDTLGLLLGVLVTTAGLPDADGARWLLAAFAAKFRRLAKLWADHAYAGDLVGWAQRCFGLDLETVERPAGQRGFVLLPRRWPVERSFAWYGRNRRLSKDYEIDPFYSESWIYLASIQLMLKRLAAPLAQETAPA
jgi:transposase